jgi:hypothetical protein
MYVAQLQQCTTGATAWGRDFSLGPTTAFSNSSSCQRIVDACKLPSTLTEPGRRLALKIKHRGRGVPTLEGCDEPWMQGTRDMYLRIHTILNGMSTGSHALTSYLVGDVHGATASPDAQQGPGVPAQLLALVDGRDLEWLGQLGPVDTHRVISNVLRTLVELNNKGWVHFDLHVGQIVCSPRLSSPPVTDGSIAACMVVDLDDMVYLGTATELPTTRECNQHRPPECDRGRVASTSDVWSLGFAMLTRRGHLTSEYVEGLKSGRRGSARTLATLRSRPPYMQLSQVEWDFIQRCLTYDWKERPTMSMLAADDYIVKGVPKSASGRRR